MLQESREPSLLTEVEQVIKDRFDKKSASTRRVPSTARDATASARIDQLKLADGMRAKMPFTADKYIVKENPHLVAWERETRKFLRQLTPKTGHRVAAVMIYEWATGITVAELMQAEKDDPDGTRPPWRADLRKINQVLRYYFGKPYMTYIASRKVPQAYRVRAGYLIKRHRPMTLTLYTEYLEGSLSDDLDLG